MADNKRGREKQAGDDDRRQRQRDVAAHLDRGEEPEPAVQEEDLEEVEAGLEAVSFPATGTTIVASVGAAPVPTPDRRYTMADLVPASTLETFDSSTEVLARVERPTVAAAMKRVVEASDPIRDEPIRGSQRDAYETTFRALGAIDSDDEDEGVDVMTDWIVERIETKGRLPGSRDVRRQAANYCRAAGHEIRNDEWLGV